MEKEVITTPNGAKQEPVAETIFRQVLEKKLKGELVEAAQLIDQLNMDMRKDDDTAGRRLVLLEAARINLMLGKYKRAHVFAEAIIELFPDDFSAKALIARICMGEFRYDTAKAYLGELPDDHHEKFLLLCSIAIKERRLVDAQQFLGKAAAVVDNEDSEYGLLWAYVRLLEGKEKEALSRVREVMKDPPHDTNLLLLAGEIFMTSGTYGEAKKVSMLVQKFAPHHDHAYAIRSFALYAEEDFEEAEKTAYLSLDSNKQNAYARTILMKCAARRGDYLYAERIGLAILNETPSYSLGRANLGDVYFNEGDYVRAKIEYESSMHLMDSLTKGARLRKARLEIMHGNLDEAVTILLTLLESTHSYYDDAMCDLWLCYERQGETEKRDEILDRMELRRAFYHRTEKIMEELGK